MHSYESMREKYGVRVNQTIDSPIMVFDYFELGEVFVALAIILIFGVLFYAWGLMLFILALTLGLGPYIRRRSERGVFFHWPYKNLGMSLPGLVNPHGTKKFSD